MNGKILVVDRYNRDMIRRNPSTLFVFGDNLARVGFGGQAKEARGEPNSVGIVTKLSPSTFLTDADVDKVRTPIIQAFARLATHLSNGGTVVWPSDGVGTGLAEMPERAPQIYISMEMCKEYLFTYVAGSVTINPYQL
jgi:hypothetical protein